MRSRRPRTDPAGPGNNLHASDLQAGCIYTRNRCLVARALLVSVTMMREPSTTATGWIHGQRACLTEGSAGIQQSGMGYDMHCCCNLSVLRFLLGHSESVAVVSQEDALEHGSTCDRSDAPGSHSSSMPTGQGVWGSQASMTFRNIFALEALSGEACPDLRPRMGRARRDATRGLGPQSRR